MLTEWFQHIQFAYAWVLGLLLLVLVMIYEYLRSYKRKQAALTVTTTHFIKDAGSMRTALRHLPFTLRCISVTFLIIALARPQQVLTAEKTKGEGIDIIICFDISGSMTEQDFTPNRLEASKAVASDFVSKRPGDNIGIVIFGNQSFTLCPLTTDHNAVLTQIKNIESGYLADDGTAIGSGIATSVDRLRNSKEKSRIIILLTDGVDFGGTIPPDLALQMAKYYGIKIYTIGVGSQQSMDVVENTPLGPVTKTKQMPFNEMLLQRLAAGSGGQYFHATDNMALQKIYASINQLEKSKIESITYNEYNDQYLPVLAAALVFLIIEVVLRYSLFRKFP